MSTVVRQASSAQGDGQKPAECVQPKAFRPIFKYLLLFIVAALLALSFITIPVAPPDLADGLIDASLGAVLSFARAQELQFGTDLVSAYGPFGFLIFPYYSQHAPIIALAANALLCFVVSLGLCLVAARIWREKQSRLCRVLAPLLLLIFAWLTPNLPEPVRVGLVVSAGFFAWGLLCFAESGRRLSLAATVLTVLTVFAALAKVSMLFQGAVSLLLVAGGLFVRGRRRIAFRMAGGLVLGFILPWLIAGQPPGNLPALLPHALAIV